jgi:hypothetical protein
MAKFFRSRTSLRLLIGGAITIFIWTLYLVRLILGIGPMHDYQGNEAPAIDYLVGAFVVTGMVATWIVARTLMERNRRR